MNKQGGNDQPASLPGQLASISRQGCSLHSGTPARIFHIYLPLSQNQNKLQVVEKQNMAGGKWQAALPVVSR